MKLLIPNPTIIKVKLQKYTNGHMVRVFSEKERVILSTYAAYRHPSHFSQLCPALHTQHHSYYASNRPLPNLLSPGCFRWRWGNLFSGPASVWPWPPLPPSLGRQPQRTASTDACITVAASDLAQFFCVLNPPLLSRPRTCLTTSRNAISALCLLSLSSRLTQR
jgi:hypothetical protein